MVDRAQAPEGTLARAAAGEALASFLVDTWVTFGLEMVAIGIGLVVAARVAVEARPLVWTVIGIELSRGIVADIYMLLRDHAPAVPVVWIVIHSVVIVTGLRALRASNRERQAKVSPLQPQSASSAPSAFAH